MRPREGEPASNARRGPRVTADEPPSCESRIRRDTRVDGMVGRVAGHDDRRVFELPIRREAAGESFEIRVHATEGIVDLYAPGTEGSERAEGLIQPQEPEAGVALRRDQPARQVDEDAVFLHRGRPGARGLGVRLTRFRGEEDSYQDSLEAQSDWDKVWYRLSGADDFADGSHDSTNDIEPYTFNQFTELNTLPIIDNTAALCSPDVNADGVLDLGDIQAFVDLFLASDLTADFNPDGVLDTGDITAFVQALLEGC